MSKELISVRGRHGLGALLLTLQFDAASGQESHSFAAQASAGRSQKARSSDKHALRRDRRVGAQARKRHQPAKVTQQATLWQGDSKVDANEGRTPQVTFIRQYVLFHGMILTTRERVENNLNGQGGWRNGGCSRPQKVFERSM